MSYATITQRPPNRIWLTRDFDHYTKTTWKDGVKVSVEVIKSTDAYLFIRANLGGCTIGSGEVDFTGPVGQFTYQVAT